MSAFDKTGIIELARFLDGFGVEIIATGGTSKALGSAGIAVTEIADATGFPEILGGRVKTLHPAVFAPILFSRDDKNHLDEMRGLGLKGIDLAVVNLYPFERAAASGDFKECIDNIDIGGPSMIRAAAKNHEFVAVAVDPGDYGSLMAEMAALDGATSLKFRRDRAGRAFALASRYDASIAEWISNSDAGEFTEMRSMQLRLKKKLRYGENPHQRAALYSLGERPGTVVAASQLQGSPPGYNNLADADAAFGLVSEFDPASHAACAIVKHGNPCGAAVAESCSRAFRKALDCDRLSAFGGVVAFNRTLDPEAAARIIENFMEVVIAPNVERSALEVLSARPNARVFSAGGLIDAERGDRDYKRISGGFLVQERDSASLNRSDMTIVTDIAPTQAQIEDLLFAWIVAKHAKSNAVVLASGGATLGIGAGQTSRVDAAREAARKARAMLKSADPGRNEGAKSLVAASDAFFPFADGLAVVAEAGAAAVVQPGGSIRDQEVIDEANRIGIAMAFSGIRSFRH